MTATLTDRSLIRIRGAEAVAWLQALVTADLEAPAPDTMTGAALLSPQGKILFDFLVARPDAETVLIEAQGGIAAALAQRLAFYRLRARIDIDAPVPVAVGVRAGAAPHGAAFADGRFPVPVWRSHDGATDGALDGAAFDGLRIDHGVTEGGRDYVLGDAFPHEVNLDQTGAIGFRKGCYVGQEVVSRMQHRGTARRRAVVVTASGPLPAPFTPVMASGREIGQIGTVSGRRALAILRLDKAADAADAGEPLTAGGVVLVPALPLGASFDLRPRAVGDA